MAKGFYKVASVNDQARPCDHEFGCSMLVLIWAICIYCHFHLTEICTQRHINQLNVRARDNIIGFHGDICCRPIT